MDLGWIEGARPIGQEEVRDHYGEWRTEVEEKSSIYSELRNLVDAIDKADEKGLLMVCQLFMFSDNMTAEGVCFKGMSSSHSLFNLVGRLHWHQMHGRFLLHII